MRMYATTAEASDTRRLFAVHRHTLSPFRLVAYAFTLLFLILGGCLLRSPAAPSLDAGEIAAKFFHWYIGYPGSPLADGAYRTSPYLAASYIDSLDETQDSEAQLSADPVLMAQDVPERFTIEDIAVEGDTATATLNLYWEGNPDPAARLVSMELIGGTWKITAVARVEP